MYLYVYTYIYVYISTYVIYIYVHPTHSNGITHSHRRSATSYLMKAMSSGSQLGATHYTTKSFDCALKSSRKVARLRHDVSALFSPSTSTKTRRITRPTLPCSAAALHHMGDCVVGVI